MTWTKWSAHDENNKLVAIRDNAEDAAGDLIKAAQERLNLVEDSIFRTEPLGAEAYRERRQVYGISSDLYKWWVNVGTIRRYRQETELE